MKQPYGVTEEFPEWLKLRDWTYVHKARCLHWLLQTPCRPPCKSFSWTDHLSGYIDEEGERVLLCQPYQIFTRDMRSIRSVCEVYGLTAVIHGRGWYGHGTVTIEIRVIA